MGRCVHGREGLAGLRTNTSEILKWDKEPDSRQVRLPAPTVFICELNGKSGCQTKGGSGGSSSSESNSTFSSFTHRPRPSGIHPELETSEKTELVTRGGLLRSQWDEKKQLRRFGKGGSERKGKS